MKKKITLTLLLTLTLVCGYLVFRSISPYVAPLPVSPDRISSVSMEDFQGSEPCPQRVRLVESAEDGLSIRMRMLETAQQTLDISYYAIHMGASTDLILGGILRAADRGVEVRLLLDGMFAKLDAPYAAALAAHPNVTIKYYNPVNLLRPQTLNARLHDKYILADNRFLLLGGANLGGQVPEPPGLRGADFLRPGGAGVQYPVL